MKSLNLTPLPDVTSDKTVLGFWIYLMTDLVLFATLFATYAVLQGNTNGGSGSRELFSLPFVLTETLILLTSSFTCGLAMLAAQKRDKAQLIFWMVVTAFLGLTFLGMEISEFSMLVQEGNNWQRSGFLSAFFTLVGTHGLHISVGLLWIGVLVFKTVKDGLSDGLLKRFVLLSLFWHLLDIVWIFIFTIVYLMGAA